MLVYHFLNAHYGLEGIRERRIKISRLMELNDPFEFLGVDLSGREFRKALKATKATISKTQGILCFSKTWKNPVLWGHYADKHKGICLGFEVPRAVLEKVDYVDFRFPRPKVLDEIFMKKLLFTKFAHWQYEQEYRGDQSNVTRAQVSEALGNLGKNVETFKARPGFTSFEVVRNKSSAMWA